MRHETLVHLARIVEDHAILLVPESPAPRADVMVDAIYRSVSMDGEGVRVPLERIEPLEPAHKVEGITAAPVAGGGHELLDADDPSQPSPLLRALL